MKIIEYFTSNDKAHWLEEIAKADWGAAKNLSRSALLRRSMMFSLRSFHLGSALSTLRPNIAATVTQARF